MSCFRLAIPELACHDVRDLPITVHEVDGIEEKLWFSVEDTEDEYLYDLAAETVEKLSVPLHAQGQELSPNRKYALYQRDGNLFLREAASDKHIRLPLTEVRILLMLSATGCAARKLLRKPRVLCRWD